LALDLPRRERRGHGVDLDLSIGDVGHRVDRQPCQFEQAVGRDDRHGEHDEPAKADAGFNDELEHLRLSLIVVFDASSA
jgi:hypothetical protein